MSIDFEEYGLLGHYRKGSGAYRKLLSSIQDKKLLELRDLLIVGLICFRLRQFSKSGKLIDFVMERAPEQSSLAKHALFVRSQLAIINHQWNDAIAYLEDLLCMDYPYDVVVTNSLAYAHWRNDNISQAMFNLERILSAHSNHAPALNSLGFILADTESDLRKAYNLCLRANRLKADYSPYLDSFGWALYKLGYRAKAIYALRKAMILAQNVDSQEVYEHLQCALNLNRAKIEIALS